MVTHHIEELPNGIEEKKRLANAALGRREFETGDETGIRREHRRLVWLRRLAKITPRTTWYRRKRRRVFR